MKYFSKITVLILMLSVLCLFVGCIMLQMTHGHEGSPLNLSGINKIAIDSQHGEEYINVSFPKKLAATGKFTVASEAELSDWKRWHDRQSSIERLISHWGEVIPISATDLAKAYGENQAMADKNYKGRLLKMTGVVSEIGRDSMTGGYIVHFIGANFIGADNYLTAGFSSGDSIIDFKRGQTITIIGRNMGRSHLRTTIADQQVQLTSVHVSHAVLFVENYRGPVDAIIHLRGVYGASNVIHYQIMYARDGSNIGNGRVSGRFATMDESYYDELIDLIVNQMLSAKNSSSQ